LCKVFSAYDWSEVERHEAPSQIVSSSPDSFFLLWNTNGGKANNRGSKENKENPAFALTLKTIKQQ